MRGKGPRDAKTQCWIGIFASNLTESEINEDELQCSRNYDQVATERDKKFHRSYRNGNHTQWVSQNGVSEYEKKEPLISKLRRCQKEETSVILDTNQSEAERIDRSSKLQIKF